MSQGILVVDDAAFMRMMVKDVLTKMGIRFLVKLRMGRKLLKV